MCPAHGKRSMAGGRRVSTFSVFSLCDLNTDAAALRNEHLLGVGLITERGGNTPDDQPRMPMAQAGEGQLQLYAAFVAEQFVPFIDHDHAQTRQRDLRIGAGEHQGQAFRGGDQRGRQAPALPGAFAAAGVAGAQADAPRDLQVIDRRLQARAVSAARARMGVIHSTVSGSRGGLRLRVVSTAGASGRSD
jgi:hypothetical protein